MKMRKLFPLMLFTLLLFSCGNEPSNQQGNTKLENKKSIESPQNTPYIDAPRIYCTIDGQQWQGGAVNGSLILENNLDVTIVDITGVAPIKNNVDFTTMINLHIRKFKGVGTYKEGISFSIKKLFREKPNMMEDQTETGQMKVTKWDAESRTISGEFSANIPSSAKRKNHITNGHFSNIILKEVIIN